MACRCVRFGVFPGAAAAAARVAARDLIVFLVPPFRCQFLSIPLAPQKALLLVRFDVSVQTHVCGLLGCCFRRIFGFFLRARDFSRSLFVVWRCFAFDRRVREPTETEGGEATTLDVLFGVAHARV